MVVMVIKYQSQYRKWLKAISLSNIFGVRTRHGGLVQMEQSLERGGQK
jgi:hypothetical protein